MGTFKFTRNGEECQVALNGLLSRCQQLGELTSAEIPMSAHGNAEGMY
jgi:hypothetical protein